MQVHETAQCACMDLLHFSFWVCRGVAQPGSAPAWGAGGRKFESSRPDHKTKKIKKLRKKPDQFSRAFLLAFRRALSQDCPKVCARVRPHAHWRCPRFVPGRAARVSVLGLFPHANARARLVVQA